MVGDDVVGRPNSTMTPPDVSITVTRLTGIDNGGACSLSASCLPVHVQLTAVLDFSWSSEHPVGPHLAWNTFCRVQAATSSPQMLTEGSNFESPAFKARTPSLHP